LSFYEVIEDDLLRVVEESRSKGKVLGVFNSTFIALIPKKDKLVSFDDFNPISL
jgi:hypothetical protein